MPAYPKRLIEVDLPIRRISAHSRREKSIRHGHISTLHIWWARRPLAACRAVICAALWPDPVDITENDVGAARKDGCALQPNICPPTFRARAKEETYQLFTFKQSVSPSDVEFSDDMFVIPARNRASRSSVSSAGSECVLLKRTDFV